LILIGPNREPRGGEGTSLISFSPEKRDEPKPQAEFAPA
jgi:hypothetical protein